MTFVFLHCAEHTDAHLVSPAEQLQAFLMLGTDLSVQVADLVHQLVPFKSGRLKMGLEMLVAVGGQAHQAGLDGFVLLADADVTAYVLGSCVVVVGGRRWRREGFPFAATLRQCGLPGASNAPRGGPLAVGDPALWAAVRARVVSMVPVCLQANGAEDVAARDGHGIPEVLLTQVAGVLIQ